MTRKPSQSAVPPAIPLMMSSKPTPTPLPSQPKNPPETSGDEQERGVEDQPTDSITQANFKFPPLRVHLDDLSHAGTNSFVTLTNPTTLLPGAINAILTHLYPASSQFPIPATRSVTLILRSTMGGVAYTTGLDLDDAHKEIHFALSHIQNCCPKHDDDRRRGEIMGVVTHEMVHCYQYNGLGTAPGGLIEGIADFVRLKAGLSPPHWNRKQKAEKWDQGYQHTAYFLEWIEERFGEGSVAKINHALNRVRYKERRFWDRLFGCSVKELWGEYIGGWDVEEQREQTSASVEVGGSKTVEETSKEIPRRKHEGEGKRSSGEEEMVVVQRQDEDEEKKKS